MQDDAPVALADEICVSLDGRAASTC